MNQKRENPESKKQGMPPVNDTEKEEKSGIIHNKDTDSSEAKPDADDGWLPPMPDEALPEPTYWPITLAFGLMLLLWGIVTSYIISIVGFVITVIALRGWIHDIRKDHQKEQVEKYG